MARQGKAKPLDTARGRRTAAGGKGRRPIAPVPVRSEQIRESEESRRARAAEASKAVKEGHTGGR
jgi:hypothetical protein